MPELIELSRNDLLKEVFRSQDELDAVKDELQRTQKAELKLALDLHDSRRINDQYFWIAFASLAVGAIAVILAVTFRVYFGA